MERFTYAAPRTVKDAVVELSSSENVKVLAGGTTLVDLMKNGVEKPQRLIDVTGITELNEFAIDGDELRFGALVRMSAVADHPEIKRTPNFIGSSMARRISAIAQYGYPGRECPSAHPLCVLPRSSISLQQATTGNWLRRDHGI